MTLKRLRQILKALADDTRLRIIALLNGRDMTVKDICAALKVSQPTISKHLLKLRLLGIVTDRREGSYMYYGLTRATDQYKIVHFLLSQFKHSLT